MANTRSDGFKSQKTSSTIEDEKNMIDFSDEVSLISFKSNDSDFPAARNTTPVRNLTPVRHNTPVHQSPQDKQVDELIAHTEEMRLYIAFETDRVPRDQTNELNLLMVQTFSALFDAHKEQVEKMRVIVNTRVSFSFHIISHPNTLQVYY